MRILLTIGFVLLASIVACCAPEGDQNPFYLGEVVIEAAPPPDETEQILDMPVHTSIIKRESFDDRFTTLPEVLAEQAGVEIQSYGGFGNFSTVSVRGVSANKMLILMDGVPLNLGLGGAVNLGELPIRNLERIEIYRGQAPARFGVSSIGGVVNLVTRKAGKQVTGDTTVSAGSFGTRSTDVFARAGTNRLNCAVSVLSQRSDGDFEFLNDNGTPSAYNSSDDFLQTRRNNYFRDFHLVANIDYDLGSSRKITVGERFSRKKQGIPGPVNAQSLRAKLTTYNHIFDVAYKDPEAFGQNTGAALGFQWHGYESRFLDVYTNSGEIGQLRQDNRNRTRNYNLSGSVTSYRGLNHEIFVTMRYSREHYSPFDRQDAQPVGMRSKRKSWRFKSEYRYRSDNNRLLATAAAGYESVTSSLAGDDPAPGWMLSPESTDKETRSDWSFGLRLRMGEELVARANVGRYYRLPSFFELFGDRGSVKGEPDLEPENGYNWDAGLSWEFGSRKRPGRLDIAYFSSSINNVIVFLQHQGVAFPGNIRKADSRGIETMIDWSFTPHWSLAASYTWQDTENGGDPPSVRGNKLPGRYEDNWDLRLKWKTHRWKFYYHFVKAEGAFLDAENFSPLEDRLLHNAGISYLVRGWTFSLDAKNLGDESFSDIDGFPLPGRSFFASVKRSF